MQSLQVPFDVLLYVNACAVVLPRFSFCSFMGNNNLAPEGTACADVAWDKTFSPSAGP